MRKVVAKDTGKLYAMKVLKKASLKGMEFEGSSLFRTEIEGVPVVGRARGVVGREVMGKSTSRS